MLYHGKIENFFSHLRLERGQFPHELLNSGSVCDDDLKPFVVEPHITNEAQRSQEKLFIRLKKTMHGWKNFQDR